MTCCMNVLYTCSVWAHSSFAECTALHQIPITTVCSYYIMLFTFRNPLCAQHMTTRGQSFALMFFAKVQKVRVATTFLVHAIIATRSLCVNFNSARENNKCGCCVHKAHVEFFSSLCNLATSLSSLI